MTDAPALIDVLHTNAPAVERADKLRLYGQFVGDWEMNLVTHAPDGERHPGHGEIHFEWVLHLLGRSRHELLLSTDR